MSARIVLVRHGPSSHSSAPGLIDRVGVEQWRAAYDAAGIQPVCQPPAALCQIASEATHVIASDLPRAVGSAERLAPGRPIQVLEVLREAPLPIPHWPPRLPLGVWGTVMYAGWLYRGYRGRDAGDPHRARAATAAELLAGMAVDGTTTLVVTHGVFRNLLARQLRGRGWTNAGRVGGYRHWSWWTFSGPAGA